jgi:hypothetical protein
LSKSSTKKIEIGEVKRLAQDHIPREGTSLLWDPGFPVTFPYSVSCLQIWCCNHYDRILGRLAQTVYDRSFPRVMPDHFCPQSISLGKLLPTPHCRSSDVKKEEVNKMGQKDG